jgi:hypothetical protein
MIDAFISAAMIATLNLPPFTPPAQVTDQPLSVRSFQDAAGSFALPPPVIRVWQRHHPVATR